MGTVTGTHAAGIGQPYDQGAENHTAASFGG
jgi:hypothetical protein